ncbi:hypothetical protein CXM95_17220 [Enterococcus sp. CR-Ec1]|uniref:Uncharacterized protein n=1 Tax=Enterococcus innesii TaxID=2839759 RepID=A0ABM7XX82_9ENTE|nr:hypothetical protein CXM95_17220 [Enterococcus sp. CR-Ec1]BDG69755.1 hypothetical protein ENLAB_33190 [Enterococcus innesii]
MNTNFYPVEVFSSDYRLYSSKAKTSLFDFQSRPPLITSFAVLNLKELRNIQLKLFIYDIDIEKFSTLEEAKSRCNSLMYK